ncbi:Zn-dependent hydrolase [bacterium CG2_30_54_10]|nr:MAG: Zn-dependent hydrolase [bacterium CG2_30_54_10]
MLNFISRNLAWLGHDCFRISGEKTIYFDPFQLGKTATADLIFITHEHFDHCSPEDVKKIQGENTILVGTEDVLARLAGKKQAVKVGDRLTMDGIQVEVLPAYNIGKKFHPKASGWVGYIVTVEGKRIYHAGDTDRIPEMKGLKADIALLPVSGTYVMTPQEAAQAALDIKPQVAIPMHFGSIVGQTSDAEKFRDSLAGKIKVVVLKRGGN